MKRAICFGLVLSLLFLIAGCENNNQTGNIRYENKYIENQDNQYMYQNGGGISNVQHGDGGYYYLHNHYLYYIDENDFSVFPICNKTDCLHDKETISEKAGYCNARIDNTAVVEKIQYYDGNIYYVSSGDGTESYDVVYLKKFNIGTQSVDTIFTFKTVIDDWIIHRGYFYYANSLVYNTDSVEKEYVEDTGSVCRVALGKSEEDSEKLYDFGKNGLSVLQAYNMHAYGNFVYYNAVTVNKKTDISDFDMTDDIGKRYCFNIKSEKQLCLNDRLGEEKISYYGFYNNKILFGSFNKNNCNVYACNLNGNNREKLFAYDKKLKAYTKFTDGKYFYFENQNRNVNDTNHKSVYLVYDLKGKKVNTVKMPFEMVTQIPFDSNYVIWNPKISDSTKENKLYVINKTEIASKSGLKSRLIYKFE